MSYAGPVPDPEAILQAWTPFRTILGVASVTTDDDHARALALIETLLDVVRDDEKHPLAEVLDYLSEQVQAYESKHIRIPEAEPGEVLRFLMDQHGLRQSDLADCAPQSRISDILAGKRGISKDIAKRLATRFHVNVGCFL